METLYDSLDHHLPNLVCNHTITFIVTGNGGGIVLLDYSNNMTPSTEGGLDKPYPSELPLTPLRRQETSTSIPYSHPMPYPANYSNPSVAGPSYPPDAGPSYHPPRTPPPPPPPPSNVGYIPTFLPNTDYINMPSSVAAPGQRGPRPGFAMGVGAGALAAGAVIFGDDFMSGFDLPSGLRDPSLTITTDPPF